LLDSSNIIESGELNGEKVLLIGDKNVDVVGKAYVNLKDFIYRIKK